MKEANLFNLSCRHCGHYQPEGRRGGSCQKLAVSVDSSWKACTLACSPFEDVFTDLDSTLTTLDTALMNLEEIVHLETAFSLSYKAYKNTSNRGIKNTNKDSLTAKKTSLS